MGFPKSTLVNWLFPENIKTVLDVFRSSNPFKIFCTIVVLVSILVVYLRFSLRVIYKRLCNKNMYRLVFLFCVFAEHNGVIS